MCVTVAKKYAFSKYSDSKLVKEILPQSLLHMEFPSSQGGRKRNSSSGAEEEQTIRPGAMDNLRPDVESTVKHRSAAMPNYFEHTYMYQGRIYSL